MRRRYDLAAARATPLPHQIAEGVVVQVGTIGAAAFLVEVFAVGDEFWAAGGFRQKLGLTSLFQLDGTPYRLRDAAAGGDDTVVAQDQRRMPAEAARHRLAALLSDDAVGGFRKNRQPAVGKISCGIADRDQWLAERGERHRMDRMAVDDALHVA